jgi:hypothetical protein
MQSSIAPQLHYCWVRLRPAAERRGPFTPGLPLMRKPDAVSRSAASHRHDQVDHTNALACAFARRGRAPLTPPRSCVRPRVALGSLVLLVKPERAPRLCSRVKASAHSRGNAPADARLLSPNLERPATAIRTIALVLLAAPTRAIALATIRWGRVPLGRGARQLPGSRPRSSSTAIAGQCTASN